MALLIDEPLWQRHGRWWCHLVSDTSLKELHAFAHALGIPQRGFGGDHYDIPEDMREHVISQGARPVSSREILAALYAAGLRPRPGSRLRD
jgi:hypothetical protein